MKDVGLKLARSEPQIWYQKNGAVYEYVATYVDDLLLAMKDPLSLIDQLSKEPYAFEFKGTEPLRAHLGCGFVRDPDGTLCMSAESYITRMEDAYGRMFGGKPPQKHCRSPLTKGDHPELDTSDLLDEEDTHKYQSMMGSLQWAVSIGRFDITTAVMTMSSFRTMPRKGHIERLKRMVGYLC